MGVLVYIDHDGGVFPRSAFEVIYFAKKIAEMKGTDLHVLTIGEIETEKIIALGKYGATKVFNFNGLTEFDSQSYTKVLSKAVADTDAEYIIFSHSYTSKSVAPRLSATLNAGLVVGVVELPTEKDGKLQFKRSAFSGKGFAYCTISSDKKIITLQSNSIPVEENEASAELVSFDVEITEQDRGVSVKEVNKATGKVSLAEAAVVVSGGRGLKGPENWDMVEALADELNAALACSRPVSDTGWRPHNEHVGQTGKTIRPNLYVAIGISGAIQHLAGVNGSKFILVINKDPEAPFFKAANYGVVGDAFDVIPRLTEALKEYKASI